MAFPVQSMPTDHEQAEKARAAGWKVDFPTRRKHCDHDWVTTDNWMIDRCTICGEERA